MDTPDPADIPEISGLDDFAPETPASAGADSADSASLMSVVRAEVSDETGAPRPLSRVEAVHARRAASSVATPEWWTFSSVATRGRRTISWLATRSRHAISSVARLSVRTVSSVATGSARAVLSIATGIGRVVLRVATRSGRAVASVGTGSAGAASSVASGSREAISSTAEQARHAIASVAAHSRRRISAAVALLALGYDSWSRAAERAVRGARGRFARRSDRTPIPAGELRDLEFERFVRRRRPRSRRGVLRRAAVAVVARPGAAAIGDGAGRDRRSRSAGSGARSAGDDQPRAGSRRGSGSSHRVARLGSAPRRSGPCGIAATRDRCNTPSITSAARRWRFTGAACRSQPRTERSHNATGRATPPTRSTFSGSRTVG